MKFLRLLLIAVSLCGCEFNASAAVTENLALYNQINQYWRDGAYLQILRIIESRERTNSGDVLALSLKQYYYIFADKNVSKAHRAAGALNTLLAASTDQKFKDLGHTMTKRVTDISTKENVAYTHEQRAALHAALQEFPFIDECFVLWGSASGQLQP